MATLYWGGGTGTWDGFDATHWYTDLARTTLSARAPSAEDDVVFDSTSNATDYTVTIANNTTVCRNVTIAGPASGNLTLAGASSWYIYGSLTLPATGLTQTFSGQIQFRGTGSYTLTNNGYAPTAGQIVFQSDGGYWTLQDAITGVSIIYLRGGTLNTNNKTVSIGTLAPDSSAAYPCALILGSSTVTCSNTFAASTTLFILDAGTSSITIGSSAPSFGNSAGGSLTFYNVTLSSNAVSTSNIYGTNTFNNLTYTTPSSARISNIVLNGNQTVTGTLTITGQSSVNRYFVRSDTIGTARTLTVGTVATLTDVDFRDVTVAGASAPWSGTRLGDCGGNTNITFPAAKTVYWNGTTGGAWSGNFWATSSGGAVNVANFPLAQDSVVIDDVGLNSGASITNSISGYNVKDITSTKTNAYTFSSTLNLYGSLTLTSSMTTTSLSPTFAGRAAQTFTSAGNTIQNITVENVGSTVTLQDNLSVSNQITLNSGTLDFNGKNVTSGSSFVFGTSLSKTLNLGSGAATISSFTTSGGSTNLTVNPSTSTITITNNSASIGIAGQTLTWHNVTFSTVPTSVTLAGNNTFNNLTFTSPTATQVSYITVSGDQTINGTLAFGGGASVTQRLGVVSNVVGTPRTFTAAAVSGLTDIDFRDITALGVSAPWSGTRLGDALGNSGITFVAGTNKYWNLAGTQNWSATAWATTSGGTPSVNDFPLAQDTCIFDDAGSAGTVTIDHFWNIKTLDMSGRASAMTLAGSSSLRPTVDIIFGLGVTYTFTGTWQCFGTGTQTFTSAGKSLASNIQIISPSCNFQHGDAYTSTGSITVQAGTYSTQNYNVACSGLNGNSATGTARTISLGTSTITCTGTTPVNFSSSTGLTLNASASTMLFAGTGASKAFNGGGKTFGAVSVTGGTGGFSISQSNTFGTLSNTAYVNLIFGAGTTQTITNFTYSGASGNVVRWYTSIPGQRATIKQSATGGSLAAVGVNSVDGGNNSGLTFTGTSPDYFYVKDIAYSAYTIQGSSNFFLFF